MSTGVIITAIVCITIISVAGIVASLFKASMMNYYNNDERNRK